MAKEKIVNLRVTQSQKRVDAGKDVFMSLSLEDAENLTEFILFIMAYEVSAGLKGALEQDQNPIFFRLINRIINEQVMDPLIEYVKNGGAKKRSEIITKIRSMRKEVYGSQENVQGWNQLVR